MKRQIIGLALGVALLGASQAQALNIDSFSEVNAFQVAGPPSDLSPGSPQNCLAYSASSGQCVASPPFVTGIPATDAVIATIEHNLDTGLVTPVSSTRLLEITRTSLTGQSSAGVAVKGIPGLQYNNGSDTTSKFTMTWDENNGVGLGAGAGVDLTKNTLPATFSNGDPTPKGPADQFRWFISAMDIKLLATVILKDADGTTAGNAFLKVPVLSGGAVPPECAVVPQVCVQPFVPGNLYHSFAAFNAPIAGNDDPARPGVSFYDDPYTAGVDTLLAPSGGPGSLDFAHIVSIKVIFDSSGNTGSNGLDLTETCFDTVPAFLGGSPVTPGTTPAPGNHVGDSVCSIPTAVPEPSTILLMGTGLLGVGLLGVRSHVSRRRRQA